MKSNFKLIAFVFLLASVGIIVPVYSVCGVCIVSSNSEDNTGKCRASENGDVCYNTGIGTACDYTHWEDGSCDDDDNPQIFGGW